VPFGRANGAAPVANPVAPIDRAAEALTAAANALFAVANALQEKLVRETLPKPSNSFTPAACSLTVAETVNEFLIAKARAARSDRYLRQIRVSLSSFARGRTGRSISEITVSDVEKWLFSKDWKVRTMRGYLADVRTLFNFAVRRGYLKSSAAAAVELPDDTSSNEAPGIHTPAQVAAVLSVAQSHDLDVLRHLVIRYFAGVRSAEAHRLREENILSDRGYIEIPASKSKTRRRRLVKIQPNLAAWLALGGHLRAMHPQRIREAVKLAGLLWPKNVTRHSFVSYHLAAFENAGKTALEAGHSEAMLFGHYRELVTRQAATEFWNIRP
jgi:integrase